MVMLSTRDRQRVSWLGQLTILLTLFIVPQVGVARAETSSSNIDSLVAEAQALYDRASYPAAIELLEKAVEQAPDDARVYYHLGHYLHYLCYDSMPLTGYGREVSDQVLQYLSRAILLDPSMGNARYFLGAEYGVRARDALRAGNADRAREELEQGRDAGGFPDWMIEYGRNLLRSCPTEAILFVQGDAETNAIEYLQLLDGYRTDVTVIPVALMNRPWFVSMVQKGLSGSHRPVAISWTNDQILDMHPYKWQANTVDVVAWSDSLPADSAGFSWMVEPDIARAGEEPRFLSAERALLVDIISTNNGLRPICFSLACPPSIMSGLESHLQLMGMVQILRPYEPATDLDIEATRALLLDETSFANLPSLRDWDMPRVSPMLQNYRTIFVRLVHACYTSGQIVSAREAMAAMWKSLPEDVLPIPEQLKGALQAMEQALQAAKP